jgi:hypothetical protein
MESASESRMRQQTAVRNWFGKSPLCVGAPSSNEGSPPSRFSSASAVSILSAADVKILCSARATASQFTFPLRFSESSWSSSSSSSAPSSSIFTLDEARSDRKDDAAENAEIGRWLMDPRPARRADDTEPGRIVADPGRADAVEGGRFAGGDSGRVAVAEGSAMRAWAETGRGSVFNCSWFRSHGCASFCVGFALLERSTKFNAALLPAGCADHGRAAGLRAAILRPAADPQPGWADRPLV